MITVKVEILAGNLVLASSIISAHVITRGIDLAKNKVISMFDELADKSVFGWTEVSIIIERQDN